MAKRTKSAAVLESKAAPSSAPSPDAMVLEGDHATAANKITMEHLAIADVKWSSGVRQRIDEAHIEQLAASMAQRGQMEPILVYRRQDDTFLVIDGRHRLQAAIRLGWKTIAAIERSPDDVEEDELAVAVHRRDLDAIEQAQAVAKVVAEIKNDMPSMSEAVQIAAVSRRLDKPLAWIRERMYLSRLSPKVQALVVGGLLPLPHARMISAIADHEEQLVLAENHGGSLDQDGKVIQGDPDTKWLQRSIEAKTQNLSNATWSLAVLTPGVDGAPTCDACGDNTANRPGLFEHAKTPTCLNMTCFRKKTTATKKIVDELAGRIVRGLPAGESVSAKSSVVTSSCPPHISPAAIAAEVKNRRAKIAKPAGQDDQAVRYRLEDEARKIAAKASEAWEGPILKQFDAMPKVSQWAICMLIGQMPPDARHYDKKKRDKAKLTPAILALAKECLNPTLKTVTTLIGDHEFDHDELWMVNSRKANGPIRNAVLAAIGIEAGPMPDEGAIYAAELKRLMDQHAEKAAAAKAGKKPVTKKGGKK